MAREDFYIVSTNDTVPASTAGTGKIGTSTIGAGGQYIVGTATAFTTEVSRGDYIVDLTNAEVKKVRDVISDTSLVVYDQFSNSLSDVDLVIVPQNDAMVVFMELENTGGSDTTINGVTFTSGAIKSFGQLNETKDQHGYVIPKVVDGGTSECTVTLTYDRRV